MTRYWMLPTLIAVAAVAFSAGMLISPGTPVSAQGNVAQSLPPIFQVGNTVTFGPQGPNLTIVQVYGNWLLLEQQRMGGFTTPIEPAEVDAGRFWLHAPSIQDSWRLVAQAK